MTLNYKKLIGIVLVFAVALLTGFTVGRIYLDNLPPVLPYVSYEELKQDDKYVDKLISQVNSGKSISSFSAFDLYLIAERKLYTSERYLKTVSGTVKPSIGPSQDMFGQRLKYDDIFILNKFSQGIASIHSQTIYNAKTNEIKINPNGNLQSDGKGATFDPNGFKNYSQEEYLEIFKVMPNLTLPYTISEKTCKSQYFSPVVKKDDLYTFSIKFTDFKDVTNAACYYTYEIKFSSGISNPPTWNSLSIDVTIDSSFRFVSIDYDEDYNVDYGIMTPSVHDKFSETFIYDDVPTPQELTGREVL